MHPLPIQYQPLPPHPPTHPYQCRNNLLSLLGKGWSLQHSVSIRLWILLLQTMSSFTEIRNWPDGTEREKIKIHQNVGYYMTKLVIHNCYRWKLPQRDIQFLLLLFLLLLLLFLFIYLFCLESLLTLFQPVRTEDEENAKGKNRKRHQANYIISFIYNYTSIISKKTPFSYQLEMMTTTGRPQ